MNEKFYVVDQNAMREEGRLLPELILKDPLALFVVPDVAFEEMIRSSKWELTFRLSLALLAKHAERARFSISTYEAMNSELTSRTPITKAKLLATEFNAYIGPLLRELATGRDGPFVRDLLSKTPAIREEMLAAHLDPQKGKLRMQTLADTWMKGEKSKDLVVQLRKKPPGDDRDAFRLAVTKIVGDEIFLHLADNDLFIKPEEARAFLKERPMILRYLYGVISDSLSWAKEGAIQASASLVNSRQYDVQYAVLATYFDGLLSNDKWAMSMYKDLCCLIAMMDTEVPDGN